MPHPTPSLRAPRLRGRALATLIAIAALFGGSTALAPAALAAEPEAGTITVSAPSSVTAGDSVSVSVAASAAVDLFAYDVTVTFDPALLTFVEESSTFPDGGFGSVAEGTGSVTFTNTRLGTSPGLEGDQTLVAFTFTALASGSATVAVSDVTLVSSTNDIAELSEVASTTVAIAAAPGATPTPTVTATATPSATPSATATPTATATPAPAGDVDDSDTPPLAATGADATLWLVVGAIAVAGIAAGVVLVVRRKAVKA
jgi:LPXTG-motif cell wall-anchored protein